MLSIELRDPGVDMTTGATSGAATRRAAADSHGAESAVAGKSGVDVEWATATIAACPWLGAWTWLPKYDFGVATEVDMPRRSGRST